MAKNNIADYKSACRNAVDAIKYIVQELSIECPFCGKYVYGEDTSDSSIHHPQCPMRKIYCAYNKISKLESSGWEWE